MKRAALTAIALLSLIGGSAAMADSRHDRNDGRRDYSHRNDDRRHDYDRRDHRSDRRDDRRDHHRWDGRRDRYDRYDRRSEGRWDGRRFHGPRYHPPHGYRHYHWRRGDRLPRAYYGRPYVIYDYGHHHLHRPPHGHHWVRVNHDVVLAAVATGVVLDVIYNHFY